jgi:hypothetical protein
LLTQIFRRFGFATVQVGWRAQTSDIVSLYASHSLNWHISQTKYSLEQAIEYQSEEELGLVGISDIAGWLATGQPRTCFN